jgi:hypothetical protein
MAILASLSSASDNYCKTYSQNVLYDGAESIMAQADTQILETGNYNKAITGWLITLMNSSAGIDNGGATNPDGLYQTYVFPVADTLPPGACEIPSCTNSSVLICNPRCGKAPQSEEAHRRLKEKKIIEGEDDPFLSMSYTMGPNDVIVSLACTPPPIKYWGNDVYISARLTEEYPYYPGINFGDTGMNNDRVNVMKEEGDDDSIYDKPYVLVTSADKDASDEVSTVYSKLLNHPEMINTREIDSSTARMYFHNTVESRAAWKSNPPDLLFTVARASLPVAVEDVQKWQSIAMPIRYYKAKDNTKSRNPFQPSLIDRVPQDMDVVSKSLPYYNEKATLSTAFAQLKESIISEKQAVPGDAGASLKYVDSLDLVNDVTGFYDDWQTILDLKNNDSFIIPTRDAIYGVPTYNSTNVIDFVLTDKTHAVFVGVRHTEAMAATYSQSQLAVMKFATGQMAQTLFFNDKDTKGSSSQYFDKGKEVPSEMQDLFFAVDIRPSGQCNGSKYCQEFDEKDYRNVKGDLLLPGDRVYALSPTSIGPAKDMIIMSTLMIFTE